MTVKSALCRGQVRTIEDAVEFWKPDHDDAMRVRDIEEIVGQCLCNFQTLKRWSSQIWKAVFGEALPNVCEEGERIGDAIRNSLEVYKKVAGLITSVGQSGYSVEGDAELGAAIQSLEGIQRDFQNRWPTFKADEIALARKEITSGEFFTGEELLRELQGCNLEGDQKATR